MKKRKKERTDIAFTKVALPWGFLGNMSAHPIQWKDKTWRTVEAAFQASRFDDPKIQELIRSEKSPMGAKMKAKNNKAHYSVDLMSAQDVSNLRELVKIKFTTHKDIAQKLKNSLKNNCYIVEDSSSRKGGRHQFWGAKLIIENGVEYWEGDNIMGEILMEVRGII